MRLAWTVFCALIVGGFSTWGFLAPALDLRRSGQLRMTTLLLRYWQDLKILPRALRFATAGTFRHPWSWDGPVFGWVLLVAVTFLLIPFGLFEIVVGDEPAVALAATLVATYVGLGCGLGLVRDTTGASSTGVHSKKRSVR
jgi:hypothetical protein